MGNIKSKPQTFKREKSKCRVCHKKRKKKITRPNGQKVCIKCFHEYFNTIK